MFPTLYCVHRFTGVSLTGLILTGLILIGLILTGSILLPLYVR